MSTPTPDNFPAILRTHAESMWSEGWYTISMALTKAAEEVEAARTLALLGEMDAAEEALKRYPFEEDAYARAAFMRGFSLGSAMAART